MNGQRQSGIESLSIGYLLIAFAVAILIAWWAADWWLLIPVFMIEAGVFYLVVGVLTSPTEAGRPVRSRTAARIASPTDCGDG